MKLLRNIWKLLTIELSTNQENRDWPIVCDYCGEETESGSSTYINVKDKPCICCNCQVKVFDYILSRKEK